MEMRQKKGGLAHLACLCEVVIDVVHGGGYNKAIDSRHCAALRQGETTTDARHAAERNRATRHGSKLEELATVPCNSGLDVIGRDGALLDCGIELVA
jgi:hypothetical protein